MISPILTKNFLKKVFTKIKEAVLRSEEEREFLIENIITLESHRTKQDLIKWLVGNIPTVLKKNTLLEFMRVFESIQKGHPKMSNTLKNNLQDISDLEIQKAYQDTYKNQ